MGRVTVERKDVAKKLPASINAAKYYSSVTADFRELKCRYPFSKLIILPTVDPYEAMIKVTAVEKSIIEELCATEEDFTDDFSKRIDLIIPPDYKEHGCRVYGGAWINLDNLPKKDVHCFSILPDGRWELCVGTPKSFSSLRNVILECVRTADNMLVAYERFQKGNTNELMMIAYSHGDEGKQEYEKDRRSYKTKK